MAQLNIFNALLLLQEKNAAYFKGAQADIMNFIEINWSKPIRVNIKNEKMPDQLRQDIEQFLLPLNNALTPCKKN
jgi:hypothetical protein